MANISQGAPGVPNQENAPKEQISESTSTVDGRQTRVVLYSDGSRRVWINGVLDHDVPVFSDVEKAAVPAEDAPSEPVVNPETVSVPTEAELAAIAQKAAEEAAALEAAAEAEAAEVAAAVEAEVAKDAPVVEGFVAKVEAEVEHVVDVVETKFEDLEFKTVAELKELAAKVGVDLGKLTKKDDIIAKLTDDSRE